MNRQLERSIANDFLRSQGTKAQRISVIKGGLIHQTFLVETSNESYFILQVVNSTVFKYTEWLMDNITKTNQFLAQNNYPKARLESILNHDGLSLIQDVKGRNWRMFKAIYPSKTKPFLTDIKDAHQAAKFLSEFHAQLIDFPLEELKESIPGFLDFNKRKVAYVQALKEAIPNRIELAKEWIEKGKAFEHILEEYAKILPKLPKRMIHGDPKLSNFLFDEKGNEIIALVDWDTLMTGTILYDIGDMVRSFCQHEEDKVEGFTFKPELLETILAGYNSGPMYTHMSELEKTHVLLGVKGVIYVQFLRFLGDYLCGDLYYFVEDEEQNLRRAINQLNLLKEIIRFEEK